MPSGMSARRMRSGPSHRRSPCRDCPTFTALCQVYNPGSVSRFRLIAPGRELRSVRRAPRCVPRAGSVPLAGSDGLASHTMLSRHGSHAGARDRGVGRGLRRTRHARMGRTNCLSSSLDAPSEAANAFAKHGVHIAAVSGTNRPRAGTNPTSRRHEPGLAPARTSRRPDFGSNVADNGYR
jgi:hypothetical protein